MSISKIVLVSAAMFAFALGQVVAQEKHTDDKHPPTHGIAVLQATKGNEIAGTLLLRQADGFVHITGKVTGLTPGKHGFHIHEFGDLRDPEGKSAGGHYNPSGDMHGGPHDAKHHAGDLGNIEANDKGIATVDVKAEGISVHHILGRSLVVHAGVDDLKSQPAGDSGPRVAVGVIGMQMPEEKD